MENKDKELNIPVDRLEDLQREAEEYLAELRSAQDEVDNMGVPSNGFSR